jgi:hypothetical protein
VAHGILLVFSNPSAPECEDAFNAWYSGTHLPEFLRVPGVKAARRFELLPDQMPWPPGLPVGGRRFLAAYEIETEDFGALRDRVMSTIPERTQSDALERDPLPLALLFEQIGETAFEISDASDGEAR